MIFQNYPITTPRFANCGILDNFEILLAVLFFCQIPLQVMLLPILILLLKILTTGSAAENRFDRNSKNSKEGVGKLKGKE